MPSFWSLALFLCQASLFSQHSSAEHSTSEETLHISPFCDLTTGVLAHILPGKSDQVLSSPRAQPRLHGRVSRCNGTQQSHESRHYCALLSGNTSARARYLFVANAVRDISTDPAVYATIGTVMYDNLMSRSRGYIVVPALPACKVLMADSDLFFQGLQTRSRNITLPSSGAFNLKPYQRLLPLPSNLHTPIMTQTIDKKQTSNRKTSKFSSRALFDHASSYRMSTYIAIPTALSFARRVHGQFSWSRC